MARRGLRIVAVLALVAVASLVGAYWLLPGRILDRYHHLSAAMGKDYRGHAASAALHLRGYSLRDVVVERIDGAIDTPLIRAREVQVDLDPLQREAEVVLRGLRLHLIASDGGVEQLGEGVAWRHFLDELAPGFAITRVAADDAQIELRLPGLADAPLPFDRVDFKLEGLDARPSHARPAPASITATARLLEHAAVQFNGVFDPDATMQRLNAEIRIDAIELARLDPYARFWRGIDFESGRATAMLRFTAQEGRARGRFVSRLSDFDVFDAKEDLGRDGDGLLGAARELFAAGGAASRARNGRLEVEDTFDTRVDLPQDNLEGLRAVLARVLVSVEPGG